MVSGSVRDFERAPSDVAIAGGQNGSRRPGRRPTLCDVLANLHLRTSSTRWIWKESSKSGICDFQGSEAAVDSAGRYWR